MPTLLHIDSSPLPGSVSRELTAEFVKSWKAAHPGSDVIDRDLAANPPTPIDANWIGAAYTPAGSLSPEQAKALAQSNELINELQQADEIVIGVAMHNFSVPAVLRLWIDQIVRAGVTFSYGEKGPQGLLQGKKVTVAVATGGVYAAGTPAASMNHVEPYLRTVLAFIGLTNVAFVTAGGTASLRSSSVDRSAFLRPALQEIRAAAV